MALTQLADVIVPQVYDSYGFVPTPITLAFINSPAVRNDPFLDEVANRGGQITTVPFWNDLDSSADPNISSDNPATLATPQKIGASSLTVRVADYNNAWSSTDLAGDLAGSDPMAIIKARTNVYWTREMQRFLASISLGIAAANVANNDADMVNDISIAAGLSAVAANLFSHNAVIDTFAKDGEFFGDLAAMIVPMTVYWNMVKQNAITFTEPSNQGIKIPLYGGQAVVLPVSDSLLSVNAATNGKKYTTILCGAGCFAWGQGSPHMPSEVRREPLQGNGGGVEILVERKRWVFGVAGHSFTSASIALQSPTSAEWGLPANWTRKYPRNAVPIAYLQTNG